MSAVETLAQPVMAIRPPASPGSMTVDWEERVNPERLREYRFSRARDALAASELGALLLFVSRAL